MLMADGAHHHVYVLQVAVGDNHRMCQAENLLS